MVVSADIIESRLTQIELGHHELMHREGEVCKLLRDIAGYQSPLRIGLVRKGTTTSPTMFGNTNNYVFAAADTFHSPITTRRVDITTFERNLIWQYQDKDGQWSDAIEMVAAAPPVHWNLACIAIRVRTSDLVSDPIVQTRYEVVLWT